MPRPGRKPFPPPSWISLPATGFASSLGRFVLGAFQQHKGLFQPQGFHGSPVTDPAAHPGTGEALNTDYPAMGQSTPGHPWNSCREQEKDTAAALILLPAFPEGQEHHFLLILRAPREIPVRVALKVPLFWHPCPRTTAQQVSVGAGIIAAVQKLHIPKAFP